MINKIIDNTDIKFELVRAMLPHIPFDGWTIKQSTSNINTHLAYRLDVSRQPFLFCFREKKNNIPLSCLSAFLCAPMKGMWYSSFSFCLVLSPEKYPSDILLCFVISETCFFPLRACFSPSFQKDSL